VQKRVEDAGFSIIKELIGHGVGRQMHEEPQVPNYGEPGTGPALKPGMVLAIEPMVNAGGPEISMGDDNWSVYSADGSLTAHFEFTVAITENGPRVLTPWHELS
jgi:methionyl aminopeptidase